MMYFYKDGVSSSEIGDDGKLERQTSDISMDGGNWDKYKKKRINKDMIENTDE